MRLAVAMTFPRRSVRFIVQVAVVMPRHDEPPLDARVTFRASPWVMAAKYAVVEVVDPTVVVVQAGEEEPA